MARPGSVAVGGYFATPEHLIPRIAALFDVLQETRPGYVTSRTLSLMDPCAGDGAAVHDLGMALADPRELDIYTCEMEATRYQALRERFTNQWRWQNQAIHGDAFQISGQGEVHVLFLNPPYDFDAEHSRLEEKFLVRFTPMVKVGGVLVFLVPFYALEASAQTLGRHYEKLHAFRFPGADFEAFKQVVLVARKREGLFEADPAVVTQVKAWAARSSSIPELPEDGPAVLQIAPSYVSPLNDWRVRTFDLAGLMSKARPWDQTSKSGVVSRIPNTIPDRPIREVMLRRFPVATPPRPAHIAAGIASGLFNGARITSKDKRLPPLLVKGVFDREYRTIEEKENKHGEVTSVVQVQQPRLVTTVLDMKTSTYHVLKGEESGSFQVSEMGVGDLLKHYGASLMEVMEAQCPILYDPRRDADTVKLPSSPRRLFTAQEHATRAIVRLLGEKDQTAILLGEIGSGKTTVALMAGKTFGAKRMLAMCPPHLLDSWKNEIATVRPDAKAWVLESISDVAALAAYTGPEPIVAILSRETGKLGHGWEAVTKACPACGASLPVGVDLVKKRARCEEQALLAHDTAAKVAVQMARKLARSNPHSVSASQLLRGRMDQAVLGRARNREEDPKFKGHPAFKGFPVEMMDMIASALSAAWKKHSEAAQRGLLWWALLESSPERLASLIRTLWDSSKESRAWRDEQFARLLVCLLPPGSQVQTDLVAELSANTKTESWMSNPWEDFSRVVNELKKGDLVYVSESRIQFQDGKRLINGEEISPKDAAERLLSTLCSVGHFTRAPECGEHLYQAIPEPRRYPVARFIARWYPHLFDMLVLDEGHEYATDGSAQERSAHRLTSLGLPTILMTGTIMNGYAESLFSNMWALSSDFREEFKREDRQRFVERYGYRKRLLQDKEAGTGEVIAFGSVTDRVVQRTEKIIGNAPGVLPVFLLRHLLPLAVTLHKSDLAIDLPACRQERCLVEAGPELIRRYRRLQEALIRAIRKDQFDPILAGKLFGQLAELPSYLDRATADVGNSEDGTYTIRYPESVGGEVVASEEPLPASTILPKEAWMLDAIERELREGRNVMVMCWHVDLLPRLSRLISERIGETVPVLHADKVTTAKRQAWIDREIVKKKRHVMVTNPVAIQTGLNNLVHFATEIWMENPACNPITYRQAIGRVDRIGQKKETRILFPVYDGTLQIQLYDLLMNKVAVSVATDGLDPEAALHAAGIGEADYLAGLSIGKQLWALLSGAKAPSKPERPGVRSLKAAR